MSLAARSGAPTRPSDAAPLPLVVAGAVAGAGAALLSYLALAIVALAAWMLDPAGDQEWSHMLEAAAGAWLAGLGLSPMVDGVSVTLLPVGFALVPLMALVGAARWAVEASAVARRGEALTVSVSAGLAFAGVGAAIAALARSLIVSPVQAAVTGGVTAFIVVGVTVLVRTRLVDMARLPSVLRDAAVAACVALAGLVAVASALLGLSVIAHLDSMNALLVELDPGASGAVLLAVLTLGYLPNAIVWSMAYVVGPGVTVAVGTTVSPFAEAASADLPGFPLLAALPGDAPAGAVGLPLAVVATGFLAGAYLRRHHHVGLGGALAALVTALGVGSATALLCWWTSGAVGTTTLQGLGPSPLAVGFGAGALIGLGTLVVVAWPERHVDG